ncbi:MAG: hypothetical protein ACK449_14165 [Planctomycetota bacterium]|jgi:hypothetical protein
MTSTTKWLLIACAAIFGIYGVDRAYQAWIEQPREVLETDIDRLTKEIDESKRLQFASQKAGKRLEEYAHRALPSDPTLARSLYQQWLLELVERHQLTSASVDASQPAPIEIKSRTKRGKRERVGYRIDYSLRGQTTLAKLSAFLDAFRRASHLQKIRSVSLNPIGNDGRLDVNLSIQVLCLDKAIHDMELSDWQLTAEAIGELKPATTLVERNPFAKGFARALQTLELKAITVNREGVTQAWFATDGRGGIEKVPEGQSIPNHLHDVFVADIESDRVLVRLSESEYWIRLGQSVGQVVAPQSDQAGNTIDQEGPKK